MSLEKFAKSKPGLALGVVLLAAATYRIGEMGQEFWAALPVSVPTKVAAKAAAKPSQGSQVPVVYRVLATPSSRVDTSATAATSSDPTRLERLFSAQIVRQGLAAPAADPNLRLPQRGGNMPPGVAPPGVPGAMALAGGIAPGLPANLFRVDGITDGGAFITGRYFKTGDELAGIAFPEPLPEGEKAHLKEVSWDAIKIMLGKKQVVLSRPKE